MDIGTCNSTRTLTDKLETRIGFGGASGYIINPTTNSFQLIYMTTGLAGIDFMLTPEIEKALKRYFK